MVCFKIKLSVALEGLVSAHGHCTVLIRSERLKGLEMVAAFQFSVGAGVPMCLSVKPAQI